MLPAERGHHLPDFCGSGEVDEIDVRGPFFNQLFRHSSGAGNDLEKLGIEARRIEDLPHLVGDERGQRGRLQQDAVACNEVHNDCSRRYGEREIPRRNDERHPARPVVDIALAVFEHPDGDGFRRQDLLRSFHEICAEMDDREHLMNICLVQGLAVLRAQQPRNLVRPFVKDLSEGLYDLQTPADRDLCPFRLCLPGFPERRQGFIHTE
ncbi:MAG: hypothetical protein BWZ01_03081 [Deltaproteobacteria bacterium ADurb.BinA179]|nr:MAG: hypothetical protein BWZ01_03081 [Deltaproteobacteria bacterium ADurb.BinA179]